MPQFDKTKAAQTAINTIKAGSKGYHKDYDRTVALADLYKKLITGEDIASLLARFTPREDEEQFKQRVRLTQLVTPAVSEKIKSPFYKVSRIDNVTRRIFFIDKETNETEAQDKVQEIEASLQEYYGDETLDDYMETRFVDLSFSDPNAFIVTEFSEFNADTEKAQPFPIEISSKEAINYKYINNTLQFLMIEKPISFTSVTPGGKESTKQGLAFVLYTDEFSIKLIQFDGKNTIANKGLNIEELVVGTEQSIKIGGKYFKVSYFEPKGEEIQAIRVGYKRDLMTRNRTYVNPFHAAVPRMQKTIKSISELDLTTTLHVYPQKLQYIQACSGELVDGQQDVCRKGVNRQGKQCGACNGTGVVIHKSTADAITLPMPKKSEDMLDLDKLLVYKNPSIELIKYQEEYVDKLEIKSMRDVFVSDSFNRIVATKTATEKELDMESVYDTLLPFANKYSAVYRKIVRLTAMFTDNGSGIKVIHNFPKDFKLKTINALLNDLKQAEDANADSFIKTEIQNDIANKLYSDNPDALNRYKIKQQHIPFSGQTPEEIQISINQGDVSRFDRILFGSFESIMSEIEAEQLGKRLDFYQMPFDKRMELIKAKVEEFIAKIEEDRKPAEGFPTGPVIEEEE